MPETITITGIDEAIRSLDELPRALRGPARRALRRQAERLAEAVRANMPVDSGTARQGVTLEEDAGGITITFETPDSPGQAAAIEFGVPQDGRPAAAPLRRAVASEANSVLAAVQSDLARALPSVADDLNSSRA